MDNINLTELLEKATSIALPEGGKRGKSLTGLTVKVYSVKTGRYMNITKDVIDKLGEKLAVATSGDYVVLKKDEENGKTPKEVRGYYKLRLPENFATEKIGEWHSVADNSVAVVFKRGEE